MSSIFTYRSRQQTCIEKLRRARVNDSTGVHAIGGGRGRQSPIRRTDQLERVYEPTRIRLVSPTTSSLSAQDYSRQRLGGTVVALQLLVYDKEKPRFGVKHCGFSGAELPLLNSPSFQYKYTPWYARGGGLNITT